jgi:hypothetical protein
LVLVYIVVQAHKVRNTNASNTSVLDPTLTLTNRTYSDRTKGEGKCTSHPITGHEGPEGSRGIALLFL